MAIQIKTVETEEELTGIQQLQAANLRKNISTSEAAEQGFLMAEYTLDFLRDMHAESPSIIAKEDDRVIGYALVAVKKIRDHHALLADLFNTIDQIYYQDTLLKNSNYVVVGQLCVDKQYRGIGLVQKLYGHFKTTLSASYEYCITDVAQANQRSLKAHQKTGFQVIDTLTYEGISWDIVLWDWHKYTSL